MFTKEKVEEIVRKKIESEEKLGTLSGGSGHIGDISYEIDNIGETTKVESGWEITYEYSTITVTEFTIYPENPPSVYGHKKCITINEKGEIIGESEKETRYIEGGRDIGKDFDFDL